MITIRIEARYNHDQQPNPWHTRLTAYNPGTDRIEAIAATEQYPTQAEAQAAGRKLAKTLNLKVKER